MHEVVVGRAIRALRRRRGWRQVDLAARAGVSQALVSAMERGNVASSSVATIRRIVAPLGARVELALTWRGADLDRVVDEDHARLGALAARRLETAGWNVQLEVTYHFGAERGSIDLLALKPAARAVLVIEVKTAIPSSEATGRKLDEKARLAPLIVRDRFGWLPAAVGGVVVVPETMRLRRLLRAQEALRRMFPASFTELRAWLAAPAGAIAGIWFLSDSSRSSRRGSEVARIRVRATRRSVNGGPDAAAGR